MYENKVTNNANRDGHMSIKRENKRVKTWEIPMKKLYGVKSKKLAKAQKQAMILAIKR